MKTCCANKNSTQFCFSTEVNWKESKSWSVTVLLVVVFSDLYDTPWESNIGGSLLKNLWNLINFFFTYFFRQLPPGCVLVAPWQPLLTNTCSRQCCQPSSLLHRISEQVWFVVGICQQVQAICSRPSPQWGRRLGGSILKQKLTWNKGAFLWWDVEEMLYVYACSSFFFLLHPLDNRPQLCAFVVLLWWFRLSLCLGKCTRTARFSWYTLSERQFLTWIDSQTTWTSFPHFFVALGQSWGPFQIYKTTWNSFYGLFLAISERLKNANNVPWVLHALAFQQMRKVIPVVYVIVEDIILHPTPPPSSVSLYFLCRQDSFLWNV